MNTRLERLHKWSLYAVVLIAFFAMYTGGTLWTITGFLFPPVVVGCWFVDRAGWGDASQTRWWNLVIVLAFVATAGFLIFTDQGILAGIRFVLLLTVIKLLSRHRIRDELQLYALAFLMIAAGTTVNDDITYGLFFALFVLAGTFSLALFHLKREVARDGSTIPAWMIPFDRRYMAVLASISVGIFLTSIAIFFGFPRIGLGYFAPDSRSGVNVSGFSDDVELGTHGTIRNNPEVVIRVEFPDGRPADVSHFHWRALTFDHYDGSGWSRTLQGERERNVYPDDDAYDLRETRASAQFDGEGRRDEHPRQMELYVEPFGSDLLPTIWPTDRLEFTLADGVAPPASSRSGHIEVDVYGDLHHTFESEIGMPYRIATGPRPTAEALRSVDEPIPTDEPSLEPFLQLPDEGMDRVAELAEQTVTEGATPYEKAEAIESYLLANYAYTTDLPEMDAEHPVEGFLFETERGHCEYYASAMVLMLRSIGIPARMVNGFLGGKWNGVGDYLAVRQGDAHSWVEVYIPRYGFVQMDPTPPGNPTEASAVVEWARETIDAARMTWMRWVIEYELETQIEAIEAAIDFVEPGGGWGTILPDADEESEDGEGAELPWREIVLWTVLAMLALGAVWTSRGRDPREAWLGLAVNALFWSFFAALWLAIFVGPGAAATIGGLAAGLGGAGLGVAATMLRRYTDAAPPTRLFRRIDRAARRAGLPRRDGEPPAAFLRRLADQFPELAPDIERFRRRYLAARFGDRRFDARTRRQIEQLVTRICKALR